MKTSTARQGLNPTQGIDEAKTLNRDRSNIGALRDPLKGSIGDL